MAVLMFREIEKLKRSILSLSALVEQSVNLAVKAAIDRDAEIASKVLQMDNEIDCTEIEVEEEGLKILALHQPVATDLRYIVAVLKINNDLERVGDHASSISKNALVLARFPVADVPYDLKGMSQLVTEMLHDALEALVNLNPVLAQSVMERDKLVDEIKDTMFESIKGRLEAGGPDVRGLVSLMNIGRELERIGDLATNVAEDIVYMIRGEIVRHSGLKRKPQKAPLSQP